MTWWKRRSDRLDADIQKHIDFETEQNIAAGMPPGEARSAALRKFGNVSLAKERSREVWGWLWLERLWQDAVYGLRGLVHTPGFAIVALLSLMLGIGASTSLFSVIYGVLIAPYPYKNPDQIWAPAVTSPKEPSNGWLNIGAANFSQFETFPASQRQWRPHTNLLCSPALTAPRVSTES
jgi:hypothetical protein